MMHFLVGVVALITASAVDQPLGSVSIESLLSSNAATVAPSDRSMAPTPTIAPLISSASSVNSALYGQSNVNSAKQQSQPTEKKSPAPAGQMMNSLFDSSSNQDSFQSSNQDSFQGISSQGKTPVSEESRMIVAGLVEAFMHKQNLLPGEKTCLEDSISQLTGDLVGTGKDVVVAIKGLVKMNGNAGAPVVPTRTSTNSQGTLVSTGIDAALKLTSLVTSATSLVKTCVQGDALQMLKLAAHHLTDMKYLGHRFVVNGVDIAHSLSDCIISYETHHYHRFGKDIGTALRKVILSNSTTGAHLPEGIPEEAIIQKTTEGLMDGFFVGGSSVEITDSARPDVDIRLDLHRCVAGNQAFFKEIFLSIWHAIAQFSVNGEQHGFGSSKAEGTPKWTGELMIALMQLPSALQKCDIDAEHQSMLMEAIQTLGDLKMHMSIPQRKASLQEISSRMAKAVEQWTDWHFKQFGEEIGVMMREFVLMMFPMKYSVDQSGRLRQELSSVQASNSDRRSSAPSVLMLSLAAFALAAMTGFAVVRAMRSRMHSPSPLATEEVDAEMADHTLDEELIE